MDSDDVAVFVSVVAFVGTLIGIFWLGLSVGEGRRDYENQKACIEYAVSDGACVSEVTIQDLIDQARKGN